MEQEGAVSLSPRRMDYVLAALGAWILWLVAIIVASATITFGIAPESSGAQSAAIEATLMLFSWTGLLLVVTVEFIITPIIVRVLLHYGLSRIAIYMMLYAVIWLGILLGPLASVFGMVGILRQMGWLTLFMLWGGWNWWMLAHRPVARVLRAMGRMAKAPWYLFESGGSIHG